MGSRCRWTCRNQHSATRPAQALLAAVEGVAPKRKKKKKKKKMSKEDMIKAAAAAQAAAKAARERGLTHEDAAKAADALLKVGARSLSCRVNSWVGPCCDVANSWWVCMLSCHMHQLRRPEHCIQQSTVPPCMDQSVRSNDYASAPAQRPWHGGLPLSESSGLFCRCMLAACARKQ